MSGEVEAVLTGKRILLGVSGSIAAYKAADLCSALGKQGADVHVVLTRNAAQFVGPPTFRALTRNPVVSDVFDEPHDKRIAHIDLAQSSDLVIVAPATANLLAKMAHGIADDMLTTCLLATPSNTPLLVAPAMNTVMWQHPATVANMSLLQSRGVQVVPPGHGLLACQDVGDGKLADVSDIAGAIIARLNPHRDLAGCNILITAGATREPLDPVRFLSNRSSGKMGYALGQAASERGANVTLVSGFATAPVPNGVELVRVETAEEMLAACQSRFVAYDVFIGTAAVADYAPAVVAQHKIKKPDDANNDDLVLRLRRTPHILTLLAEAKRAGQIVVGFAAETENLIVNARKKLQSRNLDLVVANDVTQFGAGFETDTNIVTLLHPDGRDESLPLLTKREVAARVLDAIAACLDSP